MPSLWQVLEVVALEPEGWMQGRCKLDALAKPAYVSLLCWLPLLLISGQSF